jgi:hypothetical protein
MSAYRAYWHPPSGRTAFDQWYVFTSEQLSAELTEHGLCLTSVDADQGLHVITHGRR